MSWLPGRMRHKSQSSPTTHTSPPSLQITLNALDCDYIFETYMPSHSKSALNYECLFLKLSISSLLKIYSEIPSFLSYRVLNSQEEANKC